MLSKYFAITSKLYIFVEYLTLIYNIYKHKNATEKPRL